MPVRVAVFIDYQNMYKGARSAFFPHTASHVDGQFDPLKLGGFLKGLRDPTRDLVAVRIYRGMPSNRHDAKGYGAALRQVSLWQNLPAITVRHRALNYRLPTDPKEKGIDVLLAIDFVSMAMRNEYDIGVLCSADTDLVPALEEVVRMKGPSAVQTACWDDRTRPSHSPIGVKGEVIRKYKMNFAAYQLVADQTDYTQQRRRR
jgi:hypothetical protein